MYGVHEKQLTRGLLIIFLFIFAFQCDVGEAQGKYFEEAIYKNEYALSFYPLYPPFIGDKTTLKLHTFKPAEKVTLYSDRAVEIPMAYREGSWWGEFEILEDYKEGGHYFTVWIRYPPTHPPRPPGWFSRFLEWVGFKKKPIAFWSKSIVTYKTVKKIATPEEIHLPPKITFEAEEEIVPLVMEEAIELEMVSPEAAPLLIKGSQSITFKTRTLEGSKEGYAPGTIQTREETLRINISGKAAETEIDATLYRTTATGVTQVGEKEEKISILMRRGSTEVYLGDFTADLTETEFARLNKVLSGGRVKGDYGKWGFTALYSSPKGDAKFYRSYGDGTQGPYNLGYSPVVIDSERVYVDEMLQKRGDAYTIDYQAGTITFIKRVIDAKSIIQVYYDYRQTVYQHSTYGLRAFYKPSPHLKIGTTYLDDSDSLSGAREIREGMAESPVDPQSHYVVGADGSLVSENISADGEIAYSLKNLNLFSSSATKETGRAGKLNLSSTLGPFGITARIKRVGTKFQPIADPDPKQDVWEYGGGLSFRPSSLFGSQGDYAYQKYIQSGVVYKNIYKTARALLTPERLPSLEYRFSETDESNDPVSGSQLRRVITKNSAETIYQFGVLSSSLKGTIEKWLRRSPSEEVTDYKRVNLGLATVGLEKITFSSNVELEDRKEPSGLSPQRKTYNLNLSATPSKQYFISSSVQIIDDSQGGHTNVTDLAYRAQPSQALKTDGKYTIKSVAEEFPTTSETVSKQAGSFSFDLRPLHYLRLRYLYKPNFTRIERTKTLSYNNEKQQAEINLIPVKEALIGLIYKLGRGFNIYKNDYPDYKVKEKTEDTDSTLYTLKMAPFRILSTEFNYLIDNSSSTTLASTQEPYTYLDGSGKTIKFDAIAKTSLSEEFSIDSRYTYQKIDEGTGEASSNLVNTKSHTASLKGLWNYSQNWTFSISGAYSRTTDYILSQVTYTVSPGLGFIYRLGETLRVDFDYTYSKSYAGMETEKSNYSLKTRYALSDFVNLTIQGEQEISSDPDYKLTDITGNIEITL
ncbi:hypothetical protein AMJ44_03565 [candidate division WOR-1 bacterium DG_54_3]|uniref:Gliding motility protein SprA N-terminal domain-containing protein n=1 Tax=candidate division WOR-1 bacterium DG_54_3 TaxID=1703775 RepID=A0A0S7Y488_UNCSA|nr:MAG: hypothetical protein AMJ44_03565 [candidate division WOR-1 bacterium DG_54_3]